MDFWERTWRERQDTLEEAFGTPEPNVAAFSWNDDIRLPGSCAVKFRPSTERGRNSWLWVTMGLSQPLSEEQIEEERKAGKEYSARGYELAIQTPGEETWPANALFYLLTHITDGEEIRWGETFPFGFIESEDNSPHVVVGWSDEMEAKAVGDLRALLFWPTLKPHSGPLSTSVGLFYVFAATGITAGELEAAKATSPLHLQLLLCRTGIGQVTDPQRSSVFEDPAASEEWERIRVLSVSEADVQQTVA
ncbi:MAG: suppressor of fused domain protein [Planctomycetota bacterium]